MDLWQLKTFVAVAKTLNFTRASEDLNLSQPAVSHQIKALEDELGKKLFERTKLGVELTAEGRVMLKHAGAILDTADALREDLLIQTDEIQGKLIIGAATRGLENPFHGVNSEIQQYYPNLELEIFAAGDVEEVVSMVKEGNIDIGIVGERLDLSEVSSVPYGSFDLVFVVGRNHRFAKLDKIHPDELKSEDWVLFDRSSRLRLFTENCFAKAGFEPKSVYESNDGSLIRSVVSKGNHVSCLPSWGIVDDVENGGIVPVKVEGWSKKIQVFVIWKKDRRSSTLNTVINFLLERKYEGTDSLLHDLDDEC